MKRCRLLLVTPEYHEYNLADEKTYIVEPIQFEVLASLLDKDKFEVRLLDLRLEKSSEALSRSLSEYQPDIVGFSSWTMHVSCVRRQLRRVKQQNAGIITLVGGHHLGIAPWDLADRHVDYVLMGESYLTFATLMERLREGNSDVSDLSGVAWQKDGEFFSNGAAVVTRDFPLDELPFPDRGILGKYRGNYYHLWWKPIASLRTAMGCPSRCSFCNLWRPNRGKYLAWGPEYVVEYLRTIEEPYVLFVDDHFFGDARRAYEIGERILASGIRKSYCLYSRSDVIAKDPGLVKLWAAVGLKRVRMGLESYSNDQLDSLTKCNSVENNDRAIEILKQHKVFTEGLFMVGLDYSEREFEALAEYIRSRKIEVPNITVYTPMPGTVEFEHRKNDLTFAESEYFDFQHATLKTRLDLKTFCHQYGRLLLKAQRPPAEQIRLIGLALFLRRMPSFWRYFYSVYTSHRHYRKPPHLEPDAPLLPWTPLRADGRRVKAKAELITLQ